jgi:hypothetical protein
MQLSAALQSDHFEPGNGLVRGIANPGGTVVGFVMMVAGVIVAIVVHGASFVQAAYP